MSAPVTEAAAVRERESKNRRQPTESGNMAKTLIITPSRCTACRTCELACSFKHQESGQPGIPRIRAFLQGEERNMVLTCFQCDDAACMRACPVEALVRHEETDAVVLIAERCIRCGACEAACPFGHLILHPKEHLPLKCDLCGGDPACAAFCPTRTLEYR